MWLLFFYPLCIIIEWLTFNLICHSVVRSPSLKRFLWNDSYSLKSAWALTVFTGLVSSENMAAYPDSRILHIFKCIFRYYFARQNNSNKWKGMKTGLLLHPNEHTISHAKWPTNMRHHAWENGNKAGNCTGGKSKGFFFHFPLNFHKKVWNFES